MTTRLCNMVIRKAYLHEYVESSKSPLRELFWLKS